MASTPASVWRNPVHFAAFGFGSGASPVAPGTFGTAMAVALYLLLPPMPWFNFTNLEENDLKAIFAYLKSTKPVSNVVPAPIPPDQLQ